MLTIFCQATRHDSKQEGTLQILKLIKYCALTWSVAQMFLLHDQRWTHHFRVLSPLLLLDLDLMLRLDVAAMRYCIHFLQYINIRDTVRIRTHENFYDNDTDSQRDI